MLAENKINCKQTIKIKKKFGFKCVFLKVGNIINILCFYVQA